MKTNIITPIPVDLQNTLPAGYVIYGNGHAELADLIRRSGESKTIHTVVYGGQTSPPWSSPTTRNSGKFEHYIYAIEVGSPLYLQLCRTESSAQEERTYSISQLRQEEARAHRKLGQWRDRLNKIQAAIVSLKQLDSNG